MTNRANEACSVDGCDRKLAARGMCATHYQRVRRAADAKKEPNLERPVHHYDETPHIAMGVRMPKEEYERFEARARELERSVYAHQYETVQLWMKRSDAGEKPSKAMKEFITSVHNNRHEKYMGQIRVNKNTVIAIERAAKRLEVSEYAVIRGIYGTEGV